MAQEDSRWSDGRVLVGLLTRGAFGGCRGLEPSPVVNHRERPSVAGVYALRCVARFVGAGASVSDSSRFIGAQSAVEPGANRFAALG